MFSKAKPVTTPVDEFEENIPVSLKLGENSFLFNKGGWKLNSSDMAAAAEQLEKLEQENDALENTVGMLRKEIVTVNHVKSVSMEMLVDERNKNIALENELAVYKEELGKSFHIVLELRKQLQTLSLQD